MFVVALVIPNSQKYWWALNLAICPKFARLQKKIPVMHMRYIMHECVYYIGGI